MQIIIFLKIPTLRIKKIIFILPTDRTYFFFFTFLPVDQKINLVLS